MIKVLIVDDDFMVAKVHAGFIQRTPGLHRGRGGPHRCRRPLPRPGGSGRTWCSWTSTCPTSTAWT